MSTEQAELRAERLRVAIKALDVAPDFAAGMYPETARLMRHHDMALLRTISPEDEQLALACLDAQREARRREWGGLEELLAAIPPGGDLDSIFDLEPDQAISALRAAKRCRWFGPGA
ncbi:MAG TPA: hypothetical protein VHY83_01955 [Solirubrobacteraceae bacterium]|nr:hypothetical protein [Solirubrobacteraceae bacterium]